LVTVEMAVDQSTPRHAALAERLGWAFRDEGLLIQALSHRSWCAEHPGSPSNERLEFLGDSVLGIVVTDKLFRRYPDLPEGELAKVRASLVNSAALAEIADELKVGDGILLGKGEDASGGREKPSILADATGGCLRAGWPGFQDPSSGALCPTLRRLAPLRGARSRARPRQALRRPGVCRRHLLGDRSRPVEKAG
jgi:hypothetical protein